MDTNFYAYQQRVLRVLLGWGLINGVAGLPLVLTRSSFWQQFGWQMSGWGAIDAAIAIFGLRTANTNAARYASGDLDNADALRAAENFRRILLINAGLDVAYILAGLALLRSAKPGRQGMGLSIAMQGAFLLAYDSWLANDVRGWIVDEVTD
jgi:hypothetical protein